MKFGVREICNVVFRAKSDVKIGNSIFRKGQPVLYIDTATTSTIEGAATTVYAQGGRGNTRLLSWEGEKTLTFTVEDALLSPIGFSVLSGAGLLKKTGAEGEDGGSNVHVHTTSQGIINNDGALDLDCKLCTTAPIFVMGVEPDGSLTGEVIECTAAGKDGKLTFDTKYANKQVFVDYYVSQSGTTVSEIQIDAENFAGYYYVEADTLFRRQNDGVDMPANITFPNVKIQSNFTFTMAASGDPSTFTFTMDAFPGYTYFNPTRKVLCVMQIIEDASAAAVKPDFVMDNVDEKFQNVYSYTEMETDYEDLKKTKAKTDVDADKETEAAKDTGDKAEAIYGYADSWVDTP